MNKPGRKAYYKDNTLVLSWIYFAILIFVLIIGVWSVTKGAYYFNPILSMLIVFLLILAYQCYQRIHAKPIPYVSFEEDRLTISNRTIPYETIETVFIPYDKYLVEVQLQNGEYLPIYLSYVSINDADNIRKSFVELGSHQVFQIEAPEPPRNIQNQVEKLSSTEIPGNAFFKKIRTFWSDNWAFIISAIIAAVLGEIPKNTFGLIIFWGVVISLLSFLTGVIQQKFKLMEKNESSLLLFGVILAVFRTDFIRSFDFMTVTYTMLYIVGSLLLMWIIGNIGSKIGKLFSKDATL